MNMLGPAPSLEKALWIQAKDEHNESQEKICSSKNAFRSSASAKSWVVSKQSAGFFKKRLAPYKCHVCGKFHLTSKNTK